MASGRLSTVIRLLKPVLAGIALAYLVTGFLDRPAPVHFQPDNPRAARQEEIAQSQVNLVTEKNVMKLGSPLSVSAEGGVSAAENPLAGLAASPEVQTDSPAADNGTAAVRAEVNATSGAVSAPPAE
ncbi:hypothetical protein GM415_02140 [Pseudodesulfovibrio cashew]|uniref:Uncharacterized protein n=1 Tax=Pseudodesulfovibrio cashew TaxID=2678688 RepID=A0A6I6JMR4_9BACT|nr:hypothetical protein [Pseudodesulfovibrio cashew]QGY38984.1 hypothetical protein GM415_02140 [Pseudodesulfovibrio cashew]